MTYQWGRRLKVLQEVVINGRSLKDAGALIGGVTSERCRQLLGSLSRTAAEDGLVDRETWDVSGGSIVSRYRNNFRKSEEILDYYKGKWEALHGPLDEASFEKWPASEKISSSMKDKHRKRREFERWRDQRRKNEN